MQTVPQRVKLPWVKQLQLPREGETYPGQQRAGRLIYDITLHILVHSQHTCCGARHYLFFGVRATRGCHQQLWESSHDSLIFITAMIALELPNTADPIPTLGWGGVALQEENPWCQELLWLYGAPSCQHSAFHNCLGSHAPLHSWNPFRNSPLIQNSRTLQEKPWCIAILVRWCVAILVRWCVAILVRWPREHRNLLSIQQLSGTLTSACSFNSGSGFNQALVHPDSPWGQVSQQGPSLEGGGQAPAGGGHGT